VSGSDDAISSLISESIKKFLFARFDKFQWIIDSSCFVLLVLGDDC